MASLLLLLALLAARAPDEPVLLDGPACDYGEDHPRLPGPASTRAELYDLLLGQRLRKADRERIEAVLRARFPGEATDAFLAVTQAEPYDASPSIRTFERVAAAYGKSNDPELQVEAARARFMLIRGWSSRHVGARDDGHFLEVHETYRKSAAGRKWSRLLDGFLADYRGKGEQFDEFVAAAEYEAIYRDAGDLTPGEHMADQRFLDAEVAPVRAIVRQRMGKLIERYGRSPSERTQRFVARAIDALAEYERGREGLLAPQREVIARYRSAQDDELSAQVGGAFERLRFSLEELGRTVEAAAVAGDQAEWKAAHPGPDCTPGD